MSATAAVVQGMPCIDYLRAKLLEDHGGGCRLAAVTRHRLKEFAATHKNELDQLPKTPGGLAAVSKAPENARSTGRAGQQRGPGSNVRGNLENGQEPVS